MSPKARRRHLIAAVGAAPDASSSMLDIMGDKLADLRYLPGPGAVAA